MKQDEDLGRTVIRTVPEKYLLTKTARVRYFTFSTKEGQNGYASVIRHQPRDFASHPYCPNRWAGVGGTGASKSVTCQEGKSSKPPKLSWGLFFWHEQETMTACGGCAKQSVQKKRLRYLTVVGQ